MPTAPRSLLISFPPHNQLAKVGQSLSPSQPDAQSRFPSTTNLPIVGRSIFPHTTNCPSWPGHSSPTQPIGQPLFPLTTICLLIPSLFPPSQPFSYCFPVSFLPHNHLPIVSQSLFPPNNHLPIVSQSLFSLTTSCLLFPTLSFLPHNLWLCRAATSWTC